MWMSHIIAAQQDPAITKPWVEWLFRYVWTYPNLPLGVDELAVNSIGRDGGNRKGSTAYSLSGSFLPGLMDDFRVYVADGGTLPIDMTDPVKFPKVAAEYVFVSFDGPDIVKAVMVGGTQLRCGELSIESERAAYDGTVDTVQFYGKRATFNSALPPSAAGAVIEIGPADELHRGIGRRPHRDVCEGHGFCHEPCREILRRRDAGAAIFDRTGGTTVRNRRHDADAMARWRAGDAPRRYDGLARGRLQVGGPRRKRQTRREDRLPGRPAGLQCVFFPVSPTHSARVSLPPFPSPLPWPLLKRVPSSSCACRNVVLHGGLCYRTCTSGRSAATSGASSTG